MDNINGYLENLIKEYDLPYLDVLATKNGKTIYRKTLSFDGSATGNEKVLVYSCSKPITVVAGMRLVERGIISLNDPVSKFLPFVKNAFTIQNGKKTPVKNEMTVSNLFTMTSGLDYVLETEEVLNAFKLNPDLDTISALELKFNSPLKYEPNTVYNYSLSHDLLGAVIEVATKKRFADFVNDEIFKPLGMINSTFKHVGEGLYPIYDYLDKPFKPFSNNHLWANVAKNYESGGGGLKTTACDYAKFASALANGGISDNGYLLLKPETIELLTTLSLTNLNVKNNFTCIQGDDYGYGYGVRVRIKDTDWGLLKGEFGWDGAAGSYLLVDKINNVSIVIFMNLVNWHLFFTGKHLDIVKTIYKELINET